VPPSLHGKRLVVLSEDPELAALLAGALSTLGGEVVSATSGREVVRALAVGAAAAVLDLPVGDLGAAPLLAELTRARVPAVVISGVYRGPRATSELLRLGARDVLEKPFELDTLVASVSAAAGTVAPPQEEAEDEVTGSLPLQPGALAAAPFLKASLEPVQPAPRRSAPEGLAAPLPGSAPPRPPPADAAPPTAGQLALASVPRLLVALHLGQATGALTVASGAVRKIVAVERGALVYAASNVAAERFGSICVRLGMVTAEQLAELRRGDPTARTADLLLAAGLLVPERRLELVTAQIRAIAWSTFEWRNGSYRFQAGRPPAARLPLRLEPGDLVLEGMRAVSTLERLRAELPTATHLAPRPDPAIELYALRILPAEARLLALADGTKSVGDLLRLSDLGGRDTLAFLQACRALRILDEVERVLASTRRIGFM
jgi:CheY-like chemotaxis protein